jgi:23S rRNA (cytosine1962-C5)-methyltransferase
MSLISEGDQLPGLILDRFGDHLVAQLNTAGMDRSRDILTASIQAALPTVQSVLLRNDSSSREQEGLPLTTEALFGTPPQTVELIENKVTFLAPLWDGQKTGWFYDHRLNRARLTHYVKNKYVLDVFSYLGGWGIQAAVAQAKEVDCLDASAFACDFIRKNAEKNHVKNVNVICDDAFDGLKHLIKQHKQYDVIVLACFYQTQ